MGLEPGQYSMQCWNSTSNPDQMNRPKLVFQCLQLIKAMQKRFTNGEIAIPSTDIKESRKGIEICILYRPEKSIFGDIAAFLSQTAADLSFDYRNFVKQDVGITRYFDRQEIDNVSVLGKPVPDNLTEESVAKTAAAANEFKGFRMNDEWKNGIAADQRSRPFQIPRTTLQRLHQKEGAELAGEIKAIMEAIQAAKNQTKTAWQIISMLAKGALALGGTAAVGAEIAGTWLCIVIVYTVVGVGAAIAVTGVLLAVLGAVVGAAYLALKDAANVLLVVNDTPSDVFPFREWIENGERRMVPEMIPAAPANGDFVSCGLFVYSKYQIKTSSIGTYGSAFGVSFNTGHGNFSVGMDCPNSFLGGNNSIEVHNREHAKDACSMAVKSGCLHGWTQNPYVDVKIADHWGNVNWGRAIVIKDT